MHIRKKKLNCFEKIVYMHFFGGLESQKNAFFPEKMHTFEDPGLKKTYTVFHPQDSLPKIMS